MIRPIRLKPALAVVSLASAILVADAAGAADAAQAGPCAPCVYQCHPAATAHMRAAIRVMAIAGCKPCHIRRKLGVVASRHLFLAYRFTTRPEAQAELCAAMATLSQLAQAPSVPPFDPAIQRTQLAMQLECNPAYNPPVPVQPATPAQPIPSGRTGQVAPSKPVPAAPVAAPKPGPATIPPSSETGPREF